VSFHVPAAASRLARSGNRKLARPLWPIVPGLSRQQIILRVTIGFLAVAAGIASVVVAPGLRGLLGAALALSMLAIAVIDASQFIIPNGLVAIALSLGLVHAGVADSAAPMEGIALAALRAAALALAFMLLRVGYAWLRGRQGIGLGDVKLAGVTGAWLDWQTIPIAIEVAALSALALYGLRQWTLRRPLHWTSRLPLGLFLAPATWLGWLLEVTLLAPPL
jgi:leader peptidase (prepilin peptidase) / N-methyltransferase